MTGEIISGGIALAIGILAVWIFIGMFFYGD